MNNNQKKIDTCLLDTIVVGRVEPHIYAFTTNTIPNYLKVGDTYRPVSVRLNEWKQFYPELKKVYDAKATINEEVFFRDYAVHYFLENDLRKKKLQKEDIDKNTYYSKEFFKDTRKEDVQAAIDDIINEHKNDGSKYSFYNTDTHMPEIDQYKSTGIWVPRPNQSEAINNFMIAFKKGRTNLLMYAVMRFGKSFTAMCCAKEMDAKVVLIVSAKADVKEEWRKTIESADNFREDYIFISSEKLLRNENIISETLAENKRPTIFLTLQDLQGDEVKEKHKEIFENHIDLLIIDETHFGARAEKYGKVLMSTNDIKDKNHMYESDDFVDLDEADQQIKSLKARIKLHLSGTPYRILMGSEFEKDDIISFCQFSDIVKEQKKWDQENLLNEDKKEWENPYYGFPQMIRFAFNPSTAAMKKLEEYKAKGTSYAFSALFKPRSIKKKSDGSHKKFINEKEVLDLLEVIDGSKLDDALLGFLDYDKIKEGKMCRHMVCVLPYCASCDALEELINNNANKFKNLKDYSIINISGVDNERQYKSINVVKKEISKCEKAGKKTLTLTVNRMLTGSTVEQWDTMLYFKDTASPQEYDQAIFRLQNQYIKELIDEKRDSTNGKKDLIKFNMKPQTLLVDFNPNRMFYMQEQKSLIYNVNTDEAGNSKLKERITDELNISPIIVMNKGRMEQITATDILKTVSEYSNSRGVFEETNEIPVDLSLLKFTDVRRTIELQAEIGAKDGFKQKAAEGEGNDLDMPDTENSEHKENETDETDYGEGNISESNSQIAEAEKLAKKFKTYYARILFFAFLTDDNVFSLESIISCIDKEENKRIVKNLNLNKSVLKLINGNINIFILSQLDYKIQNIRNLAADENVLPIERAKTALNKFSKLSDSEVFTPSWICKNMINLIPDKKIKETIKNGNKILDIASKAAEFATALCEKYGNELSFSLDEIKNSIYAIPTSGVAFEFTRKIYKILGLNTDNIAENFNYYDLVNIKIKDNKGNETNEIDYLKVKYLLSQNIKFNEIVLNNEENEGGEEVKFDVIIGNPPYQVSDGGGDGSSAGSIYNYIVEQSKILEPEYLSMIIPARWYSGGKGLDNFRSNMLNDDRLSKIVDYPETSDCFPDLNIRGGVCYFLWDSDHHGDCEVTNNYRGTKSTEIRPLLEEGSRTFIRYNKAISILRKVKVFNEATMDSRVSSRLPFGIPSNFADYSFELNEENNIILYRSERGNRNDANKRVFISSKHITKNIEWKDRIKVLVSKASPGGDEYPHSIISTPILAEENSVSTETYLIVDFVDNNEMGQNLISYMKTCFFRFLVGLIKNTQNISKGVFAFVPVQDLSKPWTDEKLYAKYGLNEDEISFIESMIKSME